MNKEMPLGVKIISILVIISVFVEGIYGGWAAIRSLSDNSFSFIQLFSSSVGVFIIILSFLISLPFIIISIFLWKGKNWARILLIILLTLTIIWDIYSLFKGGIYSIIEIILVIIIIYYLMKKDIKEKFS